MTSRRKLRGDQWYRQELAGQVRRHRARQRPVPWSQQELAERLGDKTKIRVARLERGDVRVTLGLIEELEAAFDLEAGALVWPLLAPNRASLAARKADEAFHRAMQEAVEEKRDRFLTGLDEEHTLRVLDAVGRLARSSPGDLRLLADMLSATADHRDPPLLATAFATVDLPLPLGPVTDDPKSRAVEDWVEAQNSRRANARREQLQGLRGRGFLIDGEEDDDGEQAW